MRNPLYPKVNSKIPHFIKEEYPAAHKLIMDFYKWLETDKNFLRVLTEFNEGQEINNQVEPYIDLIISELGWGFNRPITISKSALVSTLRDFYLSRGSENSFKYLFKVLFGEDAVISYPRERLFTLSNSNYSKDHWILTTANSLGSGIFDKIVNSDSLSMTITGQVSGTTLYIDKIVPIVYDGVQYLKIMVNETDLDFKPLETVIISTGIHSVYETIFACTKLTISSHGKQYNVGDEIAISGATIKGLAKVRSTLKGGIDNIHIIKGGQGYAVGDQVKVRSTENGNGFFATVRQVGPAGEIQAFKIWSTGYDYHELPELIIESKNGTGAVIKADSNTIGGIKTIDLIDQYWRYDVSSPKASILSSSGSGAVIDVDISGCISRNKSTYKNQRGVLETNCIIHDSNYFQHFSYEIHSRVASARFDDAVDDMVHPVGFKRYNVYLNEFTNELPTTTGVDELIIAVRLDMPTEIMPSINGSIEIASYINQNKNSSMFSINNIELLKFSENLSYTNNDFRSLTTKIFDARRETLESRTIDPEIHIVK
jgi:hypothetical protein